MHKFRPTDCDTTYKVNGVNVFVDFLESYYRIGYN